MPPNKPRYHPQDERPTVWSSEWGDQRKAIKVPAHQKTASLPPKQQTAYLHRESKGRGGKTVTLVKNLQLTEADMKSLAQKLKQACGVGGAVKVGVIELQGDQRSRLAEILQAMGYIVKIAG